MTSATQQTTTPKRAAKMTSNQSLNHLLNFTLPPRQSQPVQSLPRRSRKPGIHSGIWNKERFVNAQYRFVMNPVGDYTVHFADPDIFFQWQDILQVIIPRSSALASAASGGEHSGPDEGHTTCPICLSPPASPRMTKCGHVFCFPCILHYLNTSDNLKWVRCPICFDSVNEKQLKSVKWFDGPIVQDTDDSGPREESSMSSSKNDSSLVATPRTGSSMRMRLMQRPQITTLALPRSHTWPSDLIPPHQAPFHFLPDVYEYSKFMLATPAYLIADLTNDLHRLNTERHILADMGDELGMSFVDAAERKLRQEIAKAAALETPLLKESMDKAMRDRLAIEERFAISDRRRKVAENARTQPSDVPESFLATQSFGYNTPPLLDPTLVPTSAVSPTPLPNRNPRQRRNINPPPPSTSTYYYYQAASGLPLFLHPLDIKILFSHFSSYALFPDTITIRVEAFSEGTVNDDLRKRCKYLAHLPEGADVVFVEADLEGVVGQAGLKNFEQVLRTRRGKRKEKGRKDNKARARAEERDKMNANYSWRDVVVPPPPPIDSSVSPVEEIAPSENPAQLVGGAWGARSFASALHSTPQGRPEGGQPRLTRRGTRPEEVGDEWDMDATWHELEQRSGGRQKRHNRLVVLGGVGGRRRQ